MKRITILTTAIVLLAFLSIPLGMWAQSDYSTDYTGNVTLSTTGGTSASACKVAIEGTQYDGIKAGTGSVAGAMKITVPANTKHLHMHVAAWNGNTVSLAVTPEGYSGNIALTANSGISGNSPFNFSGDPSSSDYYKVITFANALGEATDLTFTATGGNRFVVWGVTSEEEGAGPTVATPTFDPASGTTFGNDGLSVTISCATTGASIYYTLDGSIPDDESTLYSGPISLTTTTTIKAIAYDTNDNTSNVATATYTYVDPTAPGTLNNPYTVAQARAAIDAGTGVTGVYATGIVSEIVTDYSSQYHNITFNLVDEEGDEEFLQAYRCGGTEAPNVIVGDIAVVSGNLILYNNTTYEFTQGCQLVSLTHTTPFVEAPVFNPEAGTYTEAQTVTITCATEGTTIYYTTDGTDPNNGSTLYSAAISVSETTTIKAIAYDANNNSSAITTATYTIQAPAPMQTFSQTEGHYPVEGQTYLIVDLHSNRALTSANGSGSAPTAVEIIVTDNQITTNDTELMWTFESAEGGYIIHPVGDDTKWLYTTDANNGVRVGTNSNNIWTLNVTDETNTNYLGFMNNAFSRYLGVYNNADWRTYTSVNNNIKNTQIALFVLGDAPIVPSFTIENNNEIAYNATSGSFNFTVNHPVEGGTTTVAEEVDWISNAAISGNSVTFTTTVNEEGTPRHGVITLTYTYNRATVTKDVTVTQAGNPSATMTIAEVREQGTGDVATIGIVTSCVGTTGYIQDATAAICVYGTSLTVGDEIRVTGTLSDYNCLLEITNPVVTVISSGNTVTPEVMTIAEIKASTNQGWYIRIENATVVAINNQNTTVVQGNDSIVVRGISGVEYAVNDLITLNGNIGCYNGAQIANPTDVTVQSNQEPTVTVTPARVDVPCAAAEGTLTVTYQNVMTDLGANLYWFEADGETPATYDWVVAEVNADGNVEYLIDANMGDARLAYMKLLCLDAEANEVYSNLVTFSQGHYVPDFATLPFDFDGGKADIANTDGLTQGGLGSDYGSSPKLKFDGTGDWMILHFNEEPGQLIYSIKGNTFSGGTFTVQTSADGVTYTDLAVYTELGAVDTVEFNLDANVRYIKWIYTEKDNGNVALGNIHVTKPSTAPVIIVEPALVELDADATDDVLEVTYQNITEVVAEVYFCDAEGQAAGYDWIMAEIDEDNNVYYVIDENTGDARTAYLKVHAFDDNLNDVYSNLVTISQAAFVPPFTGTTYTLATSIEPGRHYIITNGNDKAMGAQSVSSNGNQGNNRTAVAITTVGDVAQVSSDDVVEFVINGRDVNGNYFIYDASYEASFYGYLYAASSSANQLKTEEFLDANGNGLWTITFNEENNNAVITAQGNNTRNLLRYNSGSDLFSCYAGGQQPVYLYVKDEEEPTYTFYKDVTGYGEGNGNWCLIASPIGDVNPENVVNMLNAPYDLYAYDQTAAEEEWQNHKANGFDLVTGQGYLYADSVSLTLKFEGTPYTGTDSFPLVYDANSEFAGWNLVGNPFSSARYLYEDFYILNELGTELELSEREKVNPMEGVFVKATAPDQSVSFTDLGGEEPGWGGSWGKLNLRVTDGNGNNDIARIRFGEGRGLEKLMLNQSHNKLYFVVDGNEYAVTYAANMGEMPVSFKAAADGTYTLNVDAKEMQYLHLIDNLTGAEVDLLSNPTYSFEASVSDSPARFTLVFVAR